MTRNNFYLSEYFFFFFFYIFENSPRAKNLRLQLEIDANWKWNEPVVYTANPLCKLCKKLCKVVYYMNHTTQLCGSYSTQLYTTLHNGFAVYIVGISIA